MGLLSLLNFYCCRYAVQREACSMTIKSLEFLLFRFSKFVRIEIRLITQVGWVVKLLLRPPFLLDDYKTRVCHF